MTNSQSKRPVTAATESIPPLLQISAGIRAVQAALLKHHERTQTVVLKFGEERKYAAVEIGWQLLRGRAVHVKAIGEDRVETVSTRQGQDAKGRFEEAPGGFLSWLAAEHADIEERTARNYMVAARNAGLTEKSTAKDIAKLRKTKALADTPLAKLYRTEDASRELSPHEIAQQEMQFAQARLVVGKGALLNRLRTEILTEGLPGKLPPEQIEELYHTSREVTDWLNQRRPARRKAA